jgi:hypothetical protein
VFHLSLEVFAHHLLDFVAKEVGGDSYAGVRVACGLVDDNDDPLAVGGVQVALGRRVLDVL